MKKLNWMVLFLLISVLLLAACGGKDEVPTSAPPAQADGAVAVAQGDPTAGKTTFTTTCAACHGPAGEGVQGLGKDMTASEFIAGLSDAELMAFIKQGRPIGDPLNTTGVDMPPLGGNPALTDAQLADIIAFMRSIHK